MKKIRRRAALSKIWFGWKLVEKITSVSKGTSNFSPDCSARMSRFSSSGTIQRFRITSYNVCYTKLLREYETLTGDEIRKVMAGEPLGKDDDDSGSTSATGGLPSVTALPKTKPAAKGGDTAPEPSSYNFV